MNARRSPIYVAYIGEVVSILVFLTLGQVLIQIVLLGQHTTSTTATLIHQQELMSQKLLRNALLLALPDAGSRARPLAELKEDLPQWEQRHHALEGLVFHALPQGKQVSIKAHYQAMDTDLHMLITDEGMHFTNNGARLTAEHPAQADAFYNEIANLVVLDAIYTNINAQADRLNTLTRVIEIVLYALAVSFAGLGYLLVIRPARAQEKEWEALLEAARTGKDDIL